ncbi:alpha/beta fold hydrolase [Nonomuraea sediminis]|uniref:alpha/beta fold hydrolase n=1 Tax=Nonomuraea sediminis TaxID=2835864 RepID=UPI001BDCDA04|nr:alpha/beta hydrolase [Nonomuraea sediminis]
MHVEEQGAGWPVVLCHGFPELSYSWRHQLPVLAAAGYHVMAPDQRGYGRSPIPPAVEDYDIAHLTDDLLRLLDERGIERAAFVGHDWGALVVWSLALRAPERVMGVAALSVPFQPRGVMRSRAAIEEAFAGTWFYVLYFQEPGVADADLGRDPATTMRRMMGGLSDGLAGADDGRGLVERLPEPGGPPDWLTQADLDHYAAEFTRTGFTGALNWYRNLDRNWELMAPYDGALVRVPALFIGGTLDPAMRKERVESLGHWVPDLRGTVLLEGAGHWIQQERPDEVNAALVRFLDELDWTGR